MNSKFFHFGFVTLIIVLTIHISPIGAQEDVSDDVCTAFMTLQQTALATCQNQAENTVCIGSDLIELSLNEMPLATQLMGQEVAIGEFDTLTASPLALDSGTWGMAVFSVWANLPEDAPAPVQLVVYGGIELTIPPANEIPEGYTAPMQAFNLYATHETACAGMPPGVFINVPEGHVADFLVNGLRVKADTQLFIGLPPDNSYLSISRYGTSGGQIVWADNDVQLGEDVAVVLVPINSITPQVMMTPGGAIPTVTEEAQYNTRFDEPQVVYVAVGAVDGEPNKIFLQWEILNVADGVVEFVVDGKSEWQTAPATAFYQVVDVPDNAKAINLVIRVNTASQGYVYRGIDFPLPITETIFSYFE
ncbi:MAG: hypothetical protein KJ043_00305 [Anaerolineae bacterium]|nr:hypothetical protein [Anaerolineae bacterium]